MTGVLVSPTEPPAIKALGESSGIAERYGGDVLWGSPVSGLCVVQRKELSDLVASIHDGRLAKEFAQMQEVDGIRALVVEGRPKWTTEGELLDGWTRVNRGQLRGLLWSARAKGVWVDWSDDTSDTVGLVQGLVHWSNKARHESLDRVPGPKGNGWGTVSNEDYAKHLLSALPGVGVELAQRMLDHFGCVPLVWEVTADELQQVEGIGKVKARKLIEALEGVKQP